MQDIEKLCELGRSVIKTEISSLSSLLDRIDQNFYNACHLLLKTEGRVIVMGMGKSGHIARKLAATFASTGTPAFFIHPGEAKHGDFGMITKKDVLVIISYSGETEEILSILPFIQHLQIPLIALTGNIRSNLAKSATIHLDVSVSKEACPLGLAPTSSTTAALVMGDALAITLLEKRGFTKEDFAKSHPGGTLGRKLLLCVKDIMHKGDAIPKIDLGATLKTALIEMTRKKLGLTAIIDAEDKLAGIFTDGDVRRAFDQNADIQHTYIREVMTKHPKVVSPNILVTAALKIMENFKITALIVTDEKNYPIGVIHLHDVLRAGVV